MKDFLRYLTLLGIGVILYLLLIPATMEQRGGFYIGGEALLILAPLLIDHLIAQFQEIIAEMKRIWREQ